MKSSNTGLLLLGSPPPPPNFLQYSYWTLHYNCVINISIKIPPSGSDPIPVSLLKGLDNQVRNSTPFKLKHSCWTFPSERADLYYRMHCIMHTQSLEALRENTESRGLKTPIRKHYSALPTGLMKIPNEWQCSKWKWCFKISSNRVLFALITLQAWSGSERLTAEKREAIIRSNWGKQERALCIRTMSGCITEWKI